MVFSLADLDTFPQAALPDYILYNHRGEPKDTLHGLRGIALKTLLTPIRFSCEKPR